MHVPATALAPAPPWHALAAGELAPPELLLLPLLLDVLVFVVVVVVQVVPSHVVLVVVVLLEFAPGLLAGASFVVVDVFPPVVCTG